MSRILLVTLQQAIRSVILTLLPISFIALLTWATAGSATGNTADPIRAAVWFLLVAHHVPLTLATNSIAGALSYLPLGALVIPFLSTRSAYRRLVEILGQPQPRRRRAYLIFFSLWYSLFIFVLAMISQEGTIEAPLFALPVIFLVAFIFTYISGSSVDLFRNKYGAAIRLALISFTALAGVGALVVSLSLAWHFSTVVNLTQVIQPGIFGGITFLLIQMLYLPNFAIASLSYLTGVGFSLGSGTLISPFTHRLEEIPAIPLLGALPLRSHIWSISGAILVIALGFVVARIAPRYTSTSIRDFLLSFHFALALVAIAIGFIATGELLSSSLSSVGPLWWQFALAVTFESALGSGLALLLPRLREAIRARRGSHLPST